MDLFHKLESESVCINISCYVSLECTCQLVCVTGVCVCTFFYYFYFFVGEKFERGIQDAVILESDEALLVTAQEEFDDVTEDGK